jgi:DNA-binding LacI/PurR family transcriptional regulator
MIKQNNIDSIISSYYDIGYIQKRVYMSSFKYEHVRNTLRNNIVNGVWKEGERIPSERDLAILYDVSRITVKKAVENLIDENLLYRSQGKKGTYVFSPETASNKKPINLIGVAIDDVSDRFGSTLLRGIEDFLWQKKIHTIICNGDRDFEKVSDYFYSLSKNKIDGVIFSPVIDETADSTHNLKIIKLLETKKIPFVLLDREIPGYVANAVSSDHYKSTLNLTTELLNRGNRNILLLSGLNCTSMEERQKGYLDAFCNISIPANPSLQLKFNDNRLYKTLECSEVEKIKESLRKLIGTFSAVIALNNRLLHGFMVAMDDISPSWRDQIPIGIHDTYSLPLLKPKSLLQIVQPDYEVGREAARLLMQVLEEKPITTRRVVIESKIIK